MFIWQNKEVKTIVVQNILEMILTPPPKKKIPIKNKRLIMTQLDILEEASHPKPKILVLQTMVPLPALSPLR